MQNELSVLSKPLFERLFAVRLRYKHTLCAEEIEYYGMPTSGDAEIDKAMYDEMVDRYIKICDMVRYFKEDVPFYLKERTDAHDIQALVIAYLNAWIQHCQATLHPVQVPLRDLSMLDKLAEQCHSYAQENGVYRPFVSGLTRMSRGLNIHVTGSSDGVPRYKSILPELSRVLHNRPHSIVE